MLLPIVLFQIISEIAGGIGVPSAPPSTIHLISSGCGPASPGANGGPAAAINTTGANFIVLETSYASTPIVVTDVTYGNTPVPLTATTTGSGGTEQIFYFQNPTVGTGHVFSV